MPVPSFNSKRVGGHLHLGRLPASPGSDAVRFADLRPALIRAGIKFPKIPGRWPDFTRDFADWGMKGNGPQDDNAYPDDWAAAQGAGDCTCAGAGNEIQEDAKNSGRPVPKIGTRTTIEQYSLLTKEANGVAYDPQTGEGDTGLQIAQVNRYRQDPGFLDDAGHRHKIEQVLSLAPGNYQEYVEAVWLFTKVTLGVLVQQAQMDQFETGQPWDWVGGQEPEGGHDIPGMYKGRFVTWTKGTSMTLNYYSNAVEEAYASYSAESYNQVTGENATNFSQHDIEKYAVLLARQRMTT